MTRRPRPSQRDRGAALVIVALMITVLFLIVAIVIDLGITRSDRRGGQLAVDNATASAAQTLADSDAETACLDAISIAAATLDVSDPFSGADCASLDPCSASTPNSTTASSGEYVITIHHPVLANSLLMQKSSTISNAGVASSAADGTPCERIAVELRTTGDPFFGGIASPEDRSSTVHAVSRIDTGGTEEHPLNLLALERYECGVFVLSGQGDVIVASSVDSGGNRVPGIAALDSDASTTGNSCNGNAATLESSGQGSLIANGPCPANPATECSGEGRIPVLAPFVDGACTGTTDAPACREGPNGQITPDVEVSPGQFTRAPLDYRYNCKASYASESWYAAPLSQPIPGCSEQTANTDYIDELKDYVQSISSMNAATRLLPANGAWLTIGGNNPSCSVDNVTYIGNVFVNCDNFRPGDNVVFAGGNVIFRDQVTVQNSTASLTLNAPCPDPPPLTAPFCAPSISWTDGQGFSESQASTAGAWISVGGQFKISSGAVSGEFATLLFPDDNGVLNATGGDFVWEAPDGVGPFDDLAVWSEGTADHTLGGNGSITVIGALFTGQATFDYAGGAPQTMDEAQFIANRLRFTGSSTLSMAPAADRNVRFPLDPTFSLIR